MQMVNKLVATTPITTIALLMRNFIAKFVKILGFCKEFSGNRVNELGNPSFLIAHHAANADEGYADGGDCRPRTAGQDRHESADGACCDKKNREVEQFDALGYERGHYARQQPCRGDQCNQQQERHSRQNLCGTAAQTV